MKACLKNLKVPYGAIRLRLLTPYLLLLTALIFSIIVLSACATHEPMKNEVIAIEYKVVGSSAEDMQRFIAFPLEARLLKIAGVVSINSSSTYGVCMIEVRFENSQTHSKLEIVRAEVEHMRKYSKFLNDEPIVVIREGKF